MELSKTSRKLSKALRQAKKGSQVSSETKESENFLDEINAKITKRSHASKGYTSLIMLNLESL